MRLKSLAKGIAIGVVVALWVCVPVLAQTHYADVLVIENTGTSYTMFPARTPLNVDYMAAQTFMSATGLDTSVVDSSTTYAHMLTEDKLMIAYPLSGYSSNPLLFTTGNAALSAFDIIVGRGGSITVADAAALEPGNNFSFVLDGYTVLEAATNEFGGTIFLKPGGIRCVIWDAFGSLGLLGYMVDWTSPTGFNDPGGVWANEANAYDENTASFASCNVPATSWSGYLELTHAGLQPDGLRYWVTTGHADVNQIDIDMYYKAAWNDVYQGAFTTGAWQYLAYLPIEVISVATNIRVRFYNANAGIQAAQVNEVDYGRRNPVAGVTGLSTGEHVITVSADGVNLTLDVDGTSQSAALAGVTVTDTPNDWTIMSNDTPYLNSYRETVTGTLIVHYEPNTYILGAVLPDREAPAQNGTITWGVNPTGVSVRVDSLVSYSTYEAAPDDVDAADFVGELVMPADMYRPEADQEGAWPMFEPFMNPIAVMTDTPLSMFWWYLNGLIVLMVIAMVHRNIQNLWITGLAAVMFLGVGIAMASFPEWFLIVGVLALVGLAAMERSPSL